MFLFWITKSFGIAHMIQVPQFSRRKAVRLQYLGLNNSNKPSHLFFMILHGTAFKSQDGLDDKTRKLTINLHILKLMGWVQQPSHVIPGGTECVALRTCSALNKNISTGGRTWTDFTGFQFTRPLCKICKLSLTFFNWICLKMGYTPNYSHLVGIMIINHWV